MKRGEITGEHPDWKVGQVAQELGKLWKIMGDEEKKTYEQMAINDKARYENVGCNNIYNFSICVFLYKFRNFILFPFFVISEHSLNL